jgi:multimeric flavodoxin WrbA
MAYTNVTVIYHTGFGHTGKVAEAVAEGAKAAKDTNVTLLKADALDDAGWDALDASHAIIFGAPTYMGSLSAPFKAFMDASSKKWFTRQWKDKIAAGFTNSASYSGDKLLSLEQLVIFSMQHGMIWVGQTEAPPQFEAQDVAAPELINRVGSFTGLMTQSNHKAGPDIAPPAGDLETARRFGKRVAEIAGRFAKAT